MSVFAVNIDSPNINQVSIGNTTNPAEEPINLAVQTEPVASDIYFHPYQNRILVGTPTNTADKTALSAHQSYIFCRLSWYHPATWPQRKNSIPIKSFTIGLLGLYCLVELVLPLISLLIN